jgi:hypothetical protein
MAGRISLATTGQRLGQRGIQVAEALQRGRAVLGEGDGSER